MSTKRAKQTMAMPTHVVFQDLENLTFASDNDLEWLKNNLNKPLQIASVNLSMQLSVDFITVKNPDTDSVTTVFLWGNKQVDYHFE